MKHYLLYIFLFAFVYIYAEETTKIDSLSNISIEDSLLLNRDTIPHYEYTQLEYDERLMDWTLSMLDTSFCELKRDTSYTPDSVYIKRLQALPHEMEMSYNSIVRQFIERYVKKNSRQVAALIRRSEYYFPIFEEELCKAGLPQELKYLPIIESALIGKACSPMGAAGLWQLMIRTGKGLGLEINSLVDERYDPHRSTQAACKFLRSLYNMYGDWNLAIAAYNCGAGNVNKAIYRSGGKRDFWSIYNYLPRETRAYVPIFIAANYAMNYPDEHNICPDLEVHYGVLTDTIVTQKRIHLRQISDVLSVPMDTLRQLNPQYIKDIIPGAKDYAICLPMDKTGAFIQLEDTIVAYKADSLINNRRAEIDLAQQTAQSSHSSGNVTYYKIKNGDTLSGIAKKYHCSISQLQKWNGLKSTNINAGRTLKIYR